MKTRTEIAKKLIKGDMKTKYGTVSIGLNKAKREALKQEWTRQKQFLETIQKALDKHGITIDLIMEGEELSDINSALEVLK